MRVNGAIDDLLDRHRVVTGPRGGSIDPRWQIVEARETEALRSLLVRSEVSPVPLPAGWEARSVGVEELALAYLRESPDVARPLAVGAPR